MSHPTIAFLGPRGTFTEQAVHDFLAQGRIPGVPTTSQSTIKDCELLPVDSPAAALDAVRSGTAQCAVVAVESSVDGPVVHTEDALISGERVQVIAETLVPITFSIGVRPGEAEKVRAGEAHFTTHPVAQAQVRDWISAHLPNASFVPASSNGAAAKAVADGTADICAAPKRALELYGLEPLADGVADVADAFTRFGLVTLPQTPPDRTGRDRTGVAFTMPHEPGSLLNAMQQFSLRGVNLTRIGSRPTRALMGTYVFHIGMVGHIDDPAVADALAGLQREASWVRFIGSWPLASIPEAQGELTEILGDAGSLPTDYAESQAWLATMRDPNSKEGHTR